MEKSRQFSQIGLNDETKKSLQGLKETLIEGEVVNEYTIKEIQEITNRIGGEAVLSFFEEDNKYASIYCDLAKAGVKEVEPRLFELLDGTDSCEKDDYLKEVVGALGLIFLGAEKSEDYFKKAIEKDRLKANNWYPYELIPELIQIKNEKTKLVLKDILKNYPHMPERYLTMARSHLEK